jgi:hypothetical protein
MMMAVARQQAVLFFASDSYVHERSPTGVFTAEPGRKLKELLKGDVVAKILSSQFEANTYAAGPVDWLNEVALEEHRQGPIVVNREMSMAEVAGLSEAYGDVYDVTPGTLEGYRDIDSYKWVDLAGRPSWRRRLQVGADYEVLSDEHKSPREREKIPEIARVEEIFTHQASSTADIGACTQYIQCTQRTIHAIHTLCITHTTYTIYYTTHTTHTTRIHTQVQHTQQTQQTHHTHTHLVQYMQRTHHTHALEEYATHTGHARTDTTHTTHIT